MTTPCRALPEGFRGTEASIQGAFARGWRVLSLPTAPSVAATEAYVASGRSMDFFAGLHAYSSLRKNFLFYSGRDRAPEEQVQEIEALMDLPESINGDVTRVGSGPSGDDTRLARGWVFETFGVKAVTFESSYQDVTYGPGAFQ